jgi:hypothetical protein
VFSRSCSSAHRRLIGCRFSCRSQNTVPVDVWVKDNQQVGQFNQRHGLAKQTFQTQPQVTSLCDNNPSLSARSAPMKSAFALPCVIYEPDALVHSPLREYYSFSRPLDFLSLPRVFYHHSRLSSCPSPSFQFNTLTSRLSSSSQRIVSVVLDDLTPSNLAKTGRTLAGDNSNEVRADMVNADCACWSWRI